MKPLVIALLCALATTAGAADALKFQIRQYKIEGNTVLPDDRIQAALAPYTGADKDFADVQHALETLEGLFRRSGYGALQVFLPEQELNQGVVTFKVVEPKLGKVRIEGNQYYGAENIRRSLPALQEGAIPNTGDIARQLRLSNESPSRHATATLAASTEPETIDVDVKVEDEKPWRAFLSADNTGTSDTGRTRVSVGYMNANVFDRDQVFTAQATTSPEKADKVKIFGLGYKIPFYRQDESLSMYAGYSNVSSGSVQGLFNVSGKGKVLGARFSQGLPSVGDYQQHVQLGLDWRKFDTQTSFGTTAQPSSEYTVRPVSVIYLAQWQSARWSYDWTTSVSRNIPEGSDLATDAQRKGAENDYLIWRYGANAYVNLPAAWMAHVGLNGQQTSDALPSGEQFGLGGATSVRGYEERALSNDSGTSINLEGYTPELGPKFGMGDVSLRGLLFYDWGHLSRNHVLPGELSSEDLAGAGVGLRFGLNKRASVKLDVAQALRDGGGTKKGDTKAHVSATVTY
ncbi:MAG: ShlB/FhaC/HecB family hemolysin secretion/activation protein [Burkholderiales bacterium]|nr:ShlB/FhaC/HecB family hemolysin secretion/activation protein [Burkholderiales bacterium]